MNMKLIEEMLILHWCMYSYKSKKENHSDILSKPVMFCSIKEKNEISNHLFWAVKL